MSLRKGLYDVYDLHEQKDYEHEGYCILFHPDNRVLLLSVHGEIKASFTLPVKSKDISYLIESFSEHCPPDSKGDSYFCVAEAIADIAGNKTQKFGNCECCGTQLFRYGGYYGSGMCGVCHQGDAELLEEMEVTW